MAALSHGRTDDRHSWRVYVWEISLWRLVVSDKLEAFFHLLDICFGRLPGAQLLIWRLMNFAMCHVDNSHLHERGRFEVTDAWAKEHNPKFWAEMHDLYADEDGEEESSSSPWEQVKGVAP